MAIERLRRWKNPRIFVRECLGVEPDAWQDEALAAFGDNAVRRICLKACKGPGKSAVMSWMILHFISMHGDMYSKPKGVATSITGDNLRDNLWAEVGRWLKASPFLSETFQWSAERVYAKESPEDWFVSARSWPKSGNADQQANTLAGLHAPWVLFVLDESGGIPDAVASAAEGALATKNTWAKIVQGGNPTHLSGPLYRACHGERNLWHVIEVTGDPDNPKRSSRISAEWAREQIETYGADNPWVQVNVFGKFPKGAMNGVLGADEVADAMRRNLRDEEWSWAQRRMGVDVARFGDDRTVLFRRQGLMSWPPVVLRGVRTTEITARILLEARAWRPEMIFVDDTGHWGHGVIDQLIATGMPAVGVQFHGKAFDRRYGNRRAEMWLEMAEWVRRGGCLPLDRELSSELVMPTYSFVDGRFMLESKEQVRQRLGGRSPDIADAVALTFSMPEAPGEQHIGNISVRHEPGRGYVLDGTARKDSDFDPFRDA